MLFFQLFNRATFFFDCKQRNRWKDQKFDLEINFNKSKYRTVGVAKKYKGREVKVPLINQEQYKIERVETFVYLGMLIDEEEKESLKFQIKSKYVSKECKLRIYKTVIKPFMI